MTDYIIISQQNPPTADIPEFCQPGFFFNESEHLRQQKGMFHLLTALNQHTGRSEARCAFFVGTEGAISPGAAPFGSVEFAENLPETVLDELLESLQETARFAGATTLRLVNYPHCYAPKQAERLTDTLVKQGFRVLKKDQNFYLPISQNPFKTNIDESERRRLRKCREAGFQFAHWATPNIDEVVTFLQQIWLQKGYRPSLSPELLTRLLTDFSNQFYVFTVKDGNKLAALTVAVRVRQDILYNFLPVSDLAYQSFSPMVMLTDGLFTYCQQQGIQLLDLGVSLDADRRPKPSLIRFKQNLGAQSSPKLIFEKTL
jgi:hypothetical protein